MALAVDLIGLDAEGEVVWRWAARTWNGQYAAAEISLPPGEWPQSWQGPVTAEQVAHLRQLFGGRDAELTQPLPSPDLDELLAEPRASLLLVIEEWGY